MLSSNDLARAKEPFVGSKRRRALQLGLKKLTSLSGVLPDVPVGSMETPLFEGTKEQAPFCI